MRATFDDRCSAAAKRGLLPLAAVSLRGVLDSIGSGLAERLRRNDPMKAAPPSPRSPRRRYAMTSILDDFKRAARRLRRAPLFTASVVLTIAIGMGSFVSIYSIADNVLWEAMPYRDPERLAYIWRDYTWFDISRGWAGGVEVLAMREHADAIEDVATLRSGSVNLSARDGGEPQELRVIVASANFFDLLGVQPAIGRGFAPGEDVEGAPLRVVLGHELWRQRYGGDEGIVGETIYLDDEPAEVIGVMPASFHFAMHASLATPSSGAAYINMRFDLSGITGGSLAALARVQEGVSRQVVQDQLDAVIAPIDRDIFGGRGLRIWPAYLHEDLVQNVRPALLAIVAAATFMLLLLCINLATLLLARATRRSHEMAVSAALGAGRGALLRDCLAESLMLTLGGGAIGLLLARWGTAVVAGTATDLPRRYAIGVDGSVALVALAVALLLGVAAGIAPALRATRTDMASALRRAGGRVTGGRAPGAMVVAQVAISLVLLAGAGVLARSFLYLMRSDPGFDARGVLTVRVPITENRHPDEHSLVAFFTDVRRAVAGLPGVESVGGTNALPLTRATSQTDVSFPASPVNPGDELAAPLVDYFSVTPGYFRSLRVPLVTGRDFGEGDGANTPPVAIVDDTVAQYFFPGEDIVGRTMVFDGEERTVVGVVDQPRLYDIHRDDRGQVYLPLAQQPRSALSLAIRTSRDPGLLAAEVRRIVQSIEPDQPLADFRTMQEVVDTSLNGERLSLGLISAFAAGALLLATLGLYGVVANTVAGRTREMGVRMALGADAARVQALVVGGGMRLVLLGGALGLAGSLLTARFLASLLVGVEPSDPLTLAGAATVMAVVTFIACYVPALRASRVDPLVSLRYE
jgi:predicted permease